MSTSQTPAAKLNALSRPAEPLGDINPLGEQRIIVADRGWVFAGRCVDNRDGSVTIYDAQNIRAWGTTKGLGELVNGPLKTTKCDPYGVVRTTPVVQIKAVGWA